MNKPQRLFAVKEIIQHQSVGSQEELAALLKKRGYDVTQATLSRDLAELGIVRMHSDSGMRYHIGDVQDEQQYTPIVSREVLSIDRNEMMVVIRTLPGRAPGVASFLDSQRHSAVLGTIAGDDTVFVTPASVKKIAAVEKFIKDLFESSPLHKGTTT
jgi:transcriptional regulator of arginine metabolism